MRKVYLLISLFFLSNVIFSQSAHLHGNIIEGYGNHPVSNASVVLVGGKDSVILKYSRSDTSGNFSIPIKSEGKYIIMISYPSYADIVDTFSVLNISSGQMIELGAYKINSEVHILQEVIVKQNKHAIYIKGDTTEFSADSFYVKPGENAEELLKKLPGFKIDRNGNVTVQGSSVKHIYVDGEEFFGNEPTLVTQNLRADMVDKVQLYDKKTDQATFTGIDDGKRQKTINIKLKRNKNTGLFGKLDEGGGPDGYYKSQSMINFFADKYKASAYLNLGNTGVVGLGSLDQSKYGIKEDEGVIGDDGIYYVNASSSDGFDTWDGKYDGKGRPNTASGGLHYNFKSSDERFKFNGNYKFGSLETTNALNSIVEYNLPKDNIVGHSLAFSKNKLLKNSLAISSNYMLDSSSSIRINAAGTIIDKSENMESAGQSEMQENHSVLNTNLKALGIQSNDRIFNASQLFKKKLSKPRRTLSVVTNEIIDEKTTGGLLFSKNTFYNIVGGQDSIVDIHQRKSNKEHSFLLNTKLIYTEPLSKRSTLSFDIDLSHDQEVSNKVSTNLGNVLNEIDSLGTNRYSLNRMIWRSGLAYNYKYKKLRLQVGGDFGSIVFKQDYSSKLKAFENSYARFYPQANLAYSFTTQENLTFTYMGSPQFPTLQQLQPVTINIDPLNVVTGNVQLSPSYDHSLSGLYINYKERTAETFFINAGYHFVDNPIVQASYFNGAGVNTYTYVNISGGGKVKDWTGRALYRKIFKNTPYAIDLNASFSCSDLSNLTNNRLNLIKGQIYSFAPSLYFSKDKMLDFNISPLIQYNSFISSLDELRPYVYYSYSLTGSASTDVINKFRIQTDFVFNLKGKVNSFDSEVKYTVWNVSVRRFLCKNSIELKATANDILNQNLGNERMAFANGVSQITFQSIKRYFLFSLIWNFQKQKDNAMQK